MSYDELNFVVVTITKFRVPDEVRVVENSEIIFFISQLEHKLKETFSGKCNHFMLPLTIVRGIKVCPCLSVHLSFHPSVHHALQYSLCSQLLPQSFFVEPACG